MLSGVIRTKKVKRLEKTKRANKLNPLPKTRSDDYLRNRNHFNIALHINVLSSTYISSTDDGVQ